jgi:PAS domain S-box-containing protein
MYKLFQQSSADTDFQHERTILLNVLNSITDGFCFLDNEWNVCFWNKAAEKILCRSSDAILHTNLWEVFPEAKHLNLYTEYTKAKETNQPVEFEVYYEPLKLWSEVRAFPTNEGLAVYFKDITASKKLSLEINHQKKQQEAIINATGDVIWSIDNNFRLLAANKAFKENTFRYSGKNINEGDIVLEIMSAEEGAKWRPLYERALSGDTFKHDQVIHYLNNDTNYIELSFNPITDEHTGSVIGVACYSRDITASKRYISLIEHKNQKLQTKEVELEELADKLEAILNNSVDIIASADKDGFYASMNKASLYVLGYDPEELIGKHYTDFVYPDDVEITKASGDAIRKGHETTAFRNRVVKKTGELVHMIWSARWDEKKQLVFSVGRDATALYEAEKMVFENEQRFSALTNKGADMVGIVDSKGVYKFVSSNVQRVLGYKVEEMVGTNAFDLIHEDDRVPTAERFKSALESKETHIGEFRFKDASGNWRWIEVICTNMIDNEVIGGLIINSRDITERKQQEEKLREVVLSLYQQNKALKDIAFIQSHEVRRPLANILGLIEIITQDNIVGEQKTALKMLKRSAQELDMMIKKIVSTTYEYTTKLQTDEVTPTNDSL